jgi:hypothetical protein
MHSLSTIKALNDKASKMPKEMKQVDDMTNFALEHAKTLPLPVKLLAVRFISDILENAPAIQAMLAGRSNQPAEQNIGFQLS